MQVFTCLPKAQGFGNRNEVSNVPELHLLIAPSDQSDRNKVPHLINGKRILSSITPMKVAKTAGGEL